MFEIYTQKGWVEVESLDEVDAHNCCDCGESAVSVSHAGQNDRGEAILWAHCQNCAHESHCESQEAAARGW